MTRYTVIWLKELHDRVAYKWLSAASRERRRLTQIGDCIDRELRAGPEHRGHALRGHPGYRIWRLPDIEPPALVIFEVRPDDRIVNVAQILLFP